MKSICYRCYFDLKANTHHDTSASVYSFVDNKDEVADADADAITGAGADNTIVPDASLS